MSEQEQKTWRLGGAAGCSIHAIGTETRGVRAYTHIELQHEYIDPFDDHPRTRTSAHRFKFSPSDNPVNGATELRWIFAAVKHCDAPQRDIDFLCSLVAEAFSQRKT